MLLVNKGNLSSIFFEKVPSKKQFTKIYIKICEYLILERKNYINVVDSVKRWTIFVQNLVQYIITPIF
ncbi:hypothetical protein DBR39_04005 [Chryseobacterium sp. KBW03]|nr:hypothetical protein DBR39_04005 [Chryseobacterium sp. KBW03]